MNHRGAEIEHGVEVNGVWVGHTVQTCPQCQAGMAWDNEIHKHIPRDDYDFKHWTGVSPDLIRRCQEAVTERYGHSVSANNIVRLLPMAIHECRMIKVLIQRLKEAGDSPVLQSDIQGYDLILNSWKQIVRKAKKAFPELESVQNAVIE